MRKRVLALVLAVVLAAAMLPLPVSAANITEDEVVRKLNAAANSPQYSGYYTGNNQCLGFAIKLFNYIFGASLPANYATIDSYAKKGTLIEVVGTQLGNGYSADALRSLLSQAKPGDLFIAGPPTDGRHSFPHAVIIREVVKKNGVVTSIKVYDANGNWHGVDENKIATNQEWFITTSLGKGIQQDRNTSAKLYRYKDYEDSTTTPTFNFNTALTYIISPKCAPSRCLEITGQSTANKANVQIGTKKNLTSQQFQFVSVGDGYYKIVPQNSKKSLDCASQGTTAGTNIQQYDFSNNHDAQRWRLEDAGNGYCYIVPKGNTSLCLDVKSGANQDGANVQIYTRNQSSDAQKWKLIPVCNGNHTWGSWTVTKKATCGVAGQQQHTCSNCGQTATQTIAALSHEWLSWELVRKATCQEAGEEGRGCQNCGKIEYRSIPVSSHTWGSWATTKNPSCGVAGQRRRECSLCAKAETQALPALEHDYKLFASAAGQETYICAHCGDSYSIDTRSDCEKNGHTWGDWTTIKEAVCEKGGLRRHTCSVCRQTEEETIPALEHDYKLSGSADGQETYTCSYCGDSYQVDIDPIAVTGVQLDRSSVAIRERGAAALTATVTPGNATNKSVTWSSADDTIAKVDEKTGVITAVRAGQTTVTVTTADGGFTATCSVSVTSPSGGGGGGSSRPSGGGSSGSSSGGSTSKPSGGGSTSRPTTGKLPFGTVNLYYNGLFTDVGNDDWFYLNVSTAYELGLMKGTGDGVFSPRNNMTLAEAITLAARIHKRYSTGSDTFDTYDGGNWYDPYVSYALEQGIVNTYYDYTRPATREQFIHILAQALPKSELTDITGGITFVDSADITYVADVDLLTRAGVINGIALAEGEVCFDPRSAITRAEVAAVVGRMVQPSTRVGYP